MHPLHRDAAFLDPDSLAAAALLREKTDDARLSMIYTAIW
jgi:hypothetical protein